MSEVKFSAENPMIWIDEPIKIACCATSKYKPKLTIHYANGQTFTQTRLTNWVVDDNHLVVTHTKPKSFEKNDDFTTVTKEHEQETVIPMEDIVAVVEQDEYGDVSITRFKDVSYKVEFGGKK